MLRINRLRVEINTLNGVYGTDLPFSVGLNFVASSDNTFGKSSILAAIYYCLGFEQIIGGAGGIGEKVLTSVFKSEIADKEKSWSVTESGAFLELTNGIETITVFRVIKGINRDNRLVTVYYGKYDEIGDPKIQAEDMYVHAPHSATGTKGFHTYLAKFMHLELPDVRFSDGNERKLYLQVIFSCMFIEQKHGWSDIFSGMPIFGIKESKKRVIEFILNLDTLRNEKERDRLNMEKASIERDWEQLVKEIRRELYSESCEIENLPMRPRELSEMDYSRICAKTLEGSTINEAISQNEATYDSIKQLMPRVLENFDELQAELHETENSINELDSEHNYAATRLRIESDAVRRLTKDLEIINADIRNNRDAARLQQFGSESIGEISSTTCPVCKQEIHDVLITSGAESMFMNIDENIRHLEGQKGLIEFTIASRKREEEHLQKVAESIQSRLMTLRRLAHALRSDLYTSTDADASEAIAYKRNEIRNKIERLQKLDTFVSAQVEELKKLSKRWKDYIADKNKLPSKGLSESDEEKINLFRKIFITNLRKYNYSSVSSLEGVQISPETFLPTIDGFDMKFDSSASDGVRVIWAFTMALLEASNAKNGNHPNILIFDEPAQQSIVPTDMSRFFDSILREVASSQTIVAITLNSEELVGIVQNLDKKAYNIIMITKKAFALLDDTNKNKEYL